MKVFFNYADGCCYDMQRKAKRAATLFGGFDKAFALSKRNLSPVLYERYKNILEIKRGAGLWIWKYLLATQMLTDDNTYGKQIPEESYICYTDSDLYFLNSVDPLLECLQKDSHNKSIMVFRSWNWYKMSTQTKRDAFILCDADEDRYVTTAGRVGGFWLFKKNDIAREFFASMMQYCGDPRIIIPPCHQPQYNTEPCLDNQLGQPNYADFLRHSEDECLISIVAKKFHLYPYRFPVLTKEEEDRRVSENIHHGGWKSLPEHYTTHQYPALIPNKSNYSRILSFF